MGFRSTSFFFAAIALALSTQLIADESTSIRDAIRIVVVTDVEGIHYEHGCAFYELRDLLAANESHVSDAVDYSGDPIFEVIVQTRSGNSTVYVGDHWMKTDAGTTLLTTDVYARIRTLVRMRKGQGVPVSAIDSSVRRTSRIIQDPVFVEENRCKKRD